MNIKAKTPVRIDLIGGSTDNPVYSENNDSIMLSVAIDKYTHAKLQPSKKYVFKSFDKNFEKTFDDFSEVYEYYKNNTNLQKHPEIKLHIATIIYMYKNYTFNIKPFTISTSSEIPYRSGLGVSSSMVISIFKTYLDFFDFKYNDYFLALNSWAIEKSINKGLSGFEDNFICSYSGFSLIKKIGNSIECNKYYTTDNQNIVNEIENSTLLVYSKINRNNSHENNFKNINISKIQENFDDTEEAIVCAKRKHNISYILNAIKSEGIKKNKLQDNNTRLEIKKIFIDLLDYGFTGGKLCGQGAGGFFLLTCHPEDKKHLILKIEDSFEYIDFKILI
jgi:galactokinase/mevalonate kinase-like predicted kinase